MAGPRAGARLRTLPCMQGMASGVVLVAVFAAVTTAAVFLSARLLRATRRDGSDGSADV
jgi:hypothetical protein